MECSIKGAKSINQAMKNLYSVTSLIACLLIFSFPFWFPFAKQLSSSFPNASWFLNAKCFFIVGNLIIFILIGESKLKQLPHSSSASDVICDEYITRSRRRADYRKVKSVQNLMNVEGEKHGSEEKNCHDQKRKEMKKSKSVAMLHEEKKQEMRTCKSEVWGQSENVKKVEDHNVIIPREELNKRVEAFIARVNKQRLLESKLS